LGRGSALRLRNAAETASGSSAILQLGFRDRLPLTFRRACYRQRSEAPR
jgi:hypothetical protein